MNMHTDMLDIEPQPEIFTVTQLNNEVRFLLEDTFPNVWVEGEISNFAAPASGHWYFSLKDPGAQVRCALFRSNQRGLGFAPKDGMQVLIRARVSLYPNRGDFQLIADFMEERGDGKLRRAYELLKQKLEAAGLFAAAHKKPLPSVPSCIGVITSSTGAAIRDILTVLNRRYPIVPIIIYPTLVQGSSAAPAIVRAIETANNRQECDLLIIARGGGSLEDLWPFNEEIVAHAIYKSELPIVSAVGHEVDFTIADFVADVRAPTPSAAAEIVTPDCNDLLISLRRDSQRLNRCITSKLQHTLQHVKWLHTHLLQQHPKRRLVEKMQRLDYCDMALRHLMSQLLQAKNAQLAKASASLDALSPLATLKRGYAIATDAKQHVITDAQQVKIGDQVDVKLADGGLSCEVVKLI